MSKAPLNLETFQSVDHSPATLISQLTDPLIDQSKDDGGAFDPSPFITTLEQAVDSLIPLREKVSDQTSSLETDVKKSETAYSSKVAELRESFDTVVKSFSTLEDRITEVGRTAIRIGEQLESIDKLRQRASETHDIISYYRDASRGDMSRLEHLRTSGGREGRAKVAAILRRLSAVAKEVEEIEDGQETRETIDRFCERFEKDMLKLFDKSYRKGDPKMMAHCAKTLLEFNGGQSCIQVYVNQHDFFISRDRVQDASSIENSSIWRTLSEPDCVAPTSEEHLTALFDEIKVIIDQEAQIIQAVFPNPIAVMQTFIQRVFAQVVQAYIEKLLNSAKSTSTLAFLRVLHLTRSSLTTLIEHLRTHDFFRTANPSSPSNNHANANATTTNNEASAVEDKLDSPQQASTNTSSSSSSGALLLSAMLDQAMNEIFMTYLEGTRYMDKENFNLEELYKNRLLRFMSYHSSKSRALMDKSKGIKNFMKMGGSALEENIGYSEEDGKVSMDIVESMFRWHAEAIGRMVELSPPSDVPRNAFALLKVLAESYCRQYIETALKSAEIQISSFDKNNGPDLAPLTVLRNVDVCMCLWKHYVMTAIMPLASSSITVRRQMLEFDNHNTVRVEGEMSELLRTTIKTILSWLATILQRQKRMDFRPKNDDVAFTQMNTEPCTQAYSFILYTKGIIDESFTGKNREAVLCEIGVSFHSLLLDHLKKFSVSATGGLMLTKDLALYQDACSQFGIPEISERFEMLRQLGNLFIVQPDILKTYMSESHLASIDSRYLRPYLEKRTDYFDYSKKFWDDVCGGEMPETKGSESSSKITARLGGLMSEFENFKMGFSGNDEANNTQNNNRAINYNGFMAPLI